MKQIKAAISPSGGGLRIPIAIIFGGMIATSFGILAEKILEFCHVPAGDLAKAEKLFVAVGVPLTFIVVAVYVFRTLRRRYAYGYMKNYIAELQENGFSTCPRCGSSVSEHTGTGHRKVHVADKITTTTYSDGSTDKKTEAVYGHQSYKYLYHKCNNPDCALSDNIDFSFGDMPYKVRELRALILGEGNPKVYNAAATIHIGKGFFKLILIGLLIVAVLVGAMTFRNNVDRIYGAFGGDEVPDVNVLAPLGEKENEKLSEIRKIIVDAGEYKLRVSEASGFLFDADNHLDVVYFTDETFGDGYTIDFDGIKSDTGLKGEYTLMNYQGEACLFHDKEETIYAPDSDFYKTHYESVKKWTGKAVLTDILDDIKTGELYENYTDMYVLCSDDIRVFVAQDGSVQLFDERGEKSLCYSFTPQNTAKPENYADYKPMGYEDEETDELQKILNKADYNARVKWFVKGECKGQMEVIDNGDGSYTFENSYNPTDKIATGKYILYPQEKRYDYYAYKNEFTLLDTPEKHTKKDSPDTYKLLCELIPEDYVRAHLNLDNAKKKSVLGLETTYTEDFGNGKKSVLEVEIGGKMSFEYHESEDNYVEIDW